MTDETLSNLLRENRRFEPPADLAKSANITAEAYDRARSDRLAFWAEQADRLSWEQRWDQVLDWDNPPFAKWFVGGKLNAAYNCVDRHVDEGNGDRVAFHWVGEPGDTRTLTYAELKDEVCKAANALTELGVQKGDRVAIYLPMILETVIAMLACARIGAPHTVVFGGFSSDALVNRIQDCDARVVITADGGYRRGNPSALKPAVDEAVARCPDVRSVLVVQRTGQDVEWNDERDVWWHEVVDRQSADHNAEAFDSEHPLYVMYTSGTTGKPKGILHTTGGYLTGCAYTHHAIFDLKPEKDIYWCSADIGWVTGHSYIVYGPLANGATSMMYEGTPDTPHKGRWWEIVQEYKVTLFYTAPTAIRTFMKWGSDIPAKYTPGQRDQYVSLYRSSSPHSVRSIEGHGSLTTSRPPEPSGTDSPSSSTTSVTMPGMAFIADPGLPAVTPGNGLIMIWPVSVCHQVSTTGTRSPPIVARYQTYASGLIGSPTDPSTRIEDRSNFAGMSEPHFMNVRIAVGAV